MHAGRRTTSSADERRRDVRRLGVVDVEHAVALGDLLEPVRHAGERRAAPRATASGGRCPRASASGRGGHRVLAVVRARAGGSPRRAAAARRPPQLAGAVDSSRRARRRSTRGARSRRGPRRRGRTATTATSSCPGRAKTSQLGGEVGVEACRGGRGGPRRRLSSTAASGANASVSSSWKDEASQTTVASRRDVARPATATGVPTLPATATGSPAARWIVADQLGRRRLAVRAGHRDELVAAAAARPSSSSPMHRHAALARRRDDRRLARARPGLLTSARARSSSSSCLRVVPVDFDARGRDASPARRGVDADHLLAARAQRERRGQPERARPTTRQAATTQVPGRPRSARAGRAAAHVARCSAGRS